MREVLDDLQPRRLPPPRGVGPIPRSTPGGSHRRTWTRRSRAAPLRQKRERRVDGPDYRVGRKPVVTWPKPRTAVQARAAHLARHAPRPRKLAVGQLGVSPSFPSSWTGPAHVHRKRDGDAGLKPPLALPLWGLGEMGGSLRRRISKESRQAARRKPAPAENSSRAAVSLAVSCVCPRRGCLPSPSPDWIRDPATTIVEP